MGGGPVVGLVQYLRRVVSAPGHAETSDRDLLERFVRTREETAFTTLVKRHGPMVLRVCQTILGNPGDAEDAFQATFIVLVRRAKSVGRPELLANWLYGVAYRVSLNPRAARLRRQRREQLGLPMNTFTNEAGKNDVGVSLLEEMQSLPARYRLPILFCHLEGMTRRESYRSWSPSS